MKYVPNTETGAHLTWVNDKGKIVCIEKNCDFNKENKEKK